MTEPDYGRILDDALYNDGAQIRAELFLKPRLEVELAFVMGTDLAGPGLRIYDVMRATELIEFARRCIQLGTTFTAVAMDVAVLARGTERIAQLFRNT
jgi:2-oxo-hept-3-ene-1,7-dioate hydratase